MYNNIKKKDCEVLCDAAFWNLMMQLNKFQIRLTERGKDEVVNADSIQLTEIDVNEYYFINRWRRAHDLQMLTTRSNKINRW